MSLFRICKPKKHPSSSSSSSSYSRIKVLLFNQSFISLYHQPLLFHHCRFITPAEDVPNPNPPFSTFIHSFKNLFSQQPLKFTATLYAKPFSSSSSAFSDDEHGVSNLTVVDSECDFDADVGKTVELLSVVDDEEEGCSNVVDSTMVELENGDCMVASDDDDDVGLERCEGYLGFTVLYTQVKKKKFVPFSNHIACTVEMASTDDLYDMAVIDEIQMMADPCRGYAWTRALLGLKADDIHLCGDPSVF
ncbi:hypothetical protein CMV_030604 [Castanea mollissima]|uniref:ATP-dependent RNA helicase SUV3 DEXQ-box helicase domain-containing protein n=1 Tax=Castanea mollissima TaxID=60419 RepID=A0A8J4Q5N9_9ROSI|nr:hypothetical protein CMV_030604 [Castanea mollissima]